MNEAQQKEQELYMQIQMLQQQMQQVQENIENMEERLGEAQELKKGMDEFKELSVGDEILVPISNGVFAKAELKDNSNLKVNVGDGVIVGKSVDATKDLIEDQIVQIRKLKEQGQKQYQQLVQQAEKMAEELRG